MLTEKEREYQRQYHIKNRDKKLKYALNYRLRNRESILRYKREWYHRNRDEMLKYWKKYNSENKQRRRWIVTRCKYGVTESTFNSMLTSQDGRCAICDVEFTKAQKRLPHIDHCHDTGRVRGLLCHKCNAGIGFLQHSPKILVDAIIYLSLPEEKAAA